MYSLDEDVPVGAVVSFGTYPQDSDSPQPIQWYVVDKEDDKVLLLSQYVLDRPCDHDSSHWESSKIRTWLNDTFIKQAFTSDSERARICMSTIDNNSIEDLSDQEGSSQGVDDPDTEDRIFLLSIGEERKYVYDWTRYIYNDELPDKIPT